VKNCNAVSVPGKPETSCRVALPIKGPGQGGTRHGSCSTKYVRRREAKEARDIGQLELAFIANRNEECTLQEER